MGKYQSSKRSPRPITEPSSRFQSCTQCCSRKCEYCQALPCWCEDEKIVSSGASFSRYSRYLFVIKQNMTWLYSPLTPVTLDFNKMHLWSIFPEVPHIMEPTDRVFHGRILSPKSVQHDVLMEHKKNKNCETARLGIVDLKNQQCNLTLGEINNASMHGYVLSRRLNALHGSLLDQLVYQLETNDFPKHVYHKCEWYLKHIQFSNQYYDYTLT